MTYKKNEKTFLRATMSDLQSFKHQMHARARQKFEVKDKRCSYTLFQMGEKEFLWILLGSRVFLSFHMHSEIKMIHEKLLKKGSNFQNINFRGLFLSIAPPYYIQPYSIYLSIYLSFGATLSFVPCWASCNKAL